MVIYGYLHREVAILVTDKSLQYFMSVFSCVGLATFMNYRLIYEHVT
jgi:hypothetical protein